MPIDYNYITNFRRRTLGWRDISRSTDERTCIATSFPIAAVGNKIPLIFLSETALALGRETLQAVLTSFVLDYSARQKLSSTTMNFFVFMQLPVLSPTQVETASLVIGITNPRKWISTRVGSLNDACAPDLRVALRCELDALFFHLYGVERDDVDYIMETFPIVKRKDIAKHGEYRTKRLILEIYDAMAEAGRTGVPYISPSDEMTRRRR